VKSKYGYDCFADDTGLEVEALNGEPGVYSSRYAGEDCNPLDNMNKLLSALQEVNNRNAQFRTVIAAIINNDQHLFEGVVKGQITQEKKGSNGFGYDPVFMPNGYKLTFGELSNEEKNKISHRAVAMDKFIEFLGVE
jgi:XTP/dITP diphosphohydrolase